MGASRLPSALTDGNLGERDSDIVGGEARQDGRGDGGVGRHLRGGAADQGAARRVEEKRGRPRRHRERALGGREIRKTQGGRKWRWAMWLCVSDRQGARGEEEEERERDTKQRSS